MVTKERKKKIRIIRSFVEKKRREMGVSRLPGPRQEPSCEAFGEFKNLLWFGLIYTPEDQWYELKDDKILAGVYKEVLSAIGI